jgi:anti-anti-sigma regulatory factor
MAGSTNIMTAIDDANGIVLVKTTGPCTMGVCPALQAYLRTFQTPEKTDIYFDLSQAQAIDSTFTGLLLSLATKKPDARAPAMHLFQPADRVREALATMHVLSFFDICAEWPATPATWTPLPTPTADSEEAADLIIESHENLIEADERNKPEFDGVVKTFKAERERKRQVDDGQ